MTLQVADFHKERSFIEKVRENALNDNVCNIADVRAMFEKILTNRFKFIIPICDCVHSDLQLIQSNRDIRARCAICGFNLSYTTNVKMESYHVPETTVTYDTRTELFTFHYPDSDGLCLISRDDYFEIILNPKQINKQAPADFTTQFSCSIRMYTHIDQVMQSVRNSLYGKIHAHTDGIKHLLDVFIATFNTFTFDNASFAQYWMAKICSWIYESLDSCVALDCIQYICEHVFNATENTKIISCTKCKMDVMI